ncbi:MAG: 7-cyano-7-deazaguanine synthase [Nitrospirae bacterium]|nr:7-cyano-7-deazaguanine synthase [Nitrospirota bacterium]
MAKAVALLSGGLDSTLAVLVLLRQGIEVTAVTFLTHFGCDISDSSSCSRNPFPAAGKFGFEVKLCHLADGFVDIVKNPKHGHGRNMNPCIDCRILMLREAGELMGLIGADFVATGEVLGQRPMSQRRDTLNLIDREAGLKGSVLRPLSAKLMTETVPEREGLVRRELLYGFNGRSRKPQMALAKELGLTDYPAPAGGCLLTEPNFSWRLKELLANTPDPSLDDLHLLRVGRHFRLSPACKAIVGRDEKENAALESYADQSSYLLRVENVGSPVVLLSGEGSADFIPLAASLCARYSDAKHLPEVEVTAMGGREALCVERDESRENNRDSFHLTGCSFRVSVHPASEEVTEMFRIGQPSRQSGKRKAAAKRQEQKRITEV